ncbi:MAG: hypothetical protein K0Q87_4251, partial [Neobacillus sp.]|nr:hypothetical protein [Neobacillus sp.]
LISHVDILLDFGRFFYIEVIFVENVMKYI